MSDAIGADAWDERMDRYGRWAQLPLLAISTILAVAVVDAGFGSWTRFYVGLGLAGVVGVWTAAVTMRLGRGTRWNSVGFVGHTALTAVLVGINPWYGLFAWTGYMLSDRLPRPWAYVGFTATAAILAASQTAGYPNANWGSIGVYLLVFAVNLALVVALATVTERALAQNRQRGKVIAELAETNQRLEDALAENAGLHAQLLAQAREAGTLDERQRLAGEIHDTLAQGLVGIVTQLEAVVQTSPELSAKGRRHLDQARALARSSVTEARRSVRALRPEQLEQAELVEAIEGLTRRWSVDTGIPVRTETTGCPQPMPDEIEFALFRVAQEALTNVAKHAAATKVGVTVSFLGDAVLLDVLDDGHGFDPTERSAGYGLAGMRDRLARVGGLLEVESAPGEGTAVNASVRLGGTR
jgi:signal transduction histidine kinase